ncbi:unnamed protein product, partial [Tetraodon nigroviridis]
GVSCDACLKGNFRGRRFKCLICYDYDLCASCYESGATTTRHTTEHPMQCISNQNLYYGGDTFSVEQPQSFTCPYCGRMGFTETSLQDHVTSEHAETSTEVVSEEEEGGWAALAVRPVLGLIGHVLPQICPICAALPGGDPNHVTDDFTAHLTLEHPGAQRPHILPPPPSPPDHDESSSVRHVRRMFHPGRGLGGPRARRTNMHFTSSSTGGLSSSSSQSSAYTPSNREAMDPIAELLSQLSGVRRAAGGQINSSGPSASQLQQLQMQLQLERQQAQAARQQVESGRHAARRGNNPRQRRLGRAPAQRRRRQQRGGGGRKQPLVRLPALPVPFSAVSAATRGERRRRRSLGPHRVFSSRLRRLNDPKMSEAERQLLEGERADRSLFVQELLLSTLMREESSSSDEDERRDFADFGAMGCVDVMPLDVALENLQLRERSSAGKEPPPPPL